MSSSLHNKQTVLTQQNYRDLTLFKEGCLMDDSDNISAEALAGRVNLEDHYQAPLSDKNHRARLTGVCDGCRKRKSKCDLNRPKCRPCRNRGLKCIYSMRKKPGPRRDSSSSQVHQTRACLELLTENQPNQPNQPNHQQTEGDFGPNLLSTSPRLSHFEVCEGLEHFWLDLGNAHNSPLQNAYDANIPAPMSTNPNIIHLPCNIAPETPPDLYPHELPHDLRDHLIDLYFLYIQPVYPLLRRGAFLERLRLGKVSLHLLNVMYALSARFSSKGDVMNPVNGEAWRAGDVFAERSSQYQTALSRSRGQKSLEYLQAVVLQIIFETTRFPDRKAWVTTSNAVQIAYELGLDKVDSHHHSKNLSSDSADEEARYLWWCIWKLDMCFGMGLATPFGIENATNLTALPHTSETDFTSGKIGQTQNVYLRKTSDVSMSMKQLGVSGVAIPENFLILVNSLLREASSIRRLSATESACPLLRHRRSLLMENLSNFQANMPSAYETAFDLGSETSIHHLKRLETSLQLHLAYIYIHLPISISATENDISSNWQKCIQHAEAIVNTLRNWPLGYFQHADPMISFAFWIVFLILSLQAKSCRVDTEICRLNMAMDQLSLVVGHFAPYWGVARILLESFRDLKSSSTIHTDLLNIQKTISQYEGPLNQIPRRFNNNIPIHQSQAREDGTLIQACFDSGNNFNAFWIGEETNLFEGEILMNQE